MHIICTKSTFVQYMFSNELTFMLRAGGTPADDPETADQDNTARSLSVKPLNIFTLGSEYVSTYRTAPENTANVPL